MNILYIYSNCSNKKYEELFRDSQIMILQQAQKYHSLLIDGLKENGAEVTCVSGLPINRELIKQLYIKKESEIINGVRYRYYGLINIPIMRQLSLFFHGMVSVFSFIEKKTENMVICDYLNVSHSAGALLAAKICKINTVCIVTDIPGFMANDESARAGFFKMILSIFNKIYQFVLHNFNAYIFLTKQMNEVVNTKHKPFLVLEGHVDKKMSDFSNVSNDKYLPTVVLYAGSIHKIYGIQILVEAFVNLHIDNCELHIYGDGDFASSLNDLCKANPQVRYCGVKANHLIVQEELKATLLVNPRPTNNAYTKYSFPSKNMEYMASGTPLLTTKLPGMPPEYLEHVYLIEDESSAGLTSTLRSVLTKPRSELHTKGDNAKTFVLMEKNNVLQSAKVLKFLHSFNTKEPLFQL